MSDIITGHAPNKEYDFDPRKLPQDVLEAIGLATACSAQTENVVEMAIAGCLSVDMEYGGALTTHMTAPLRDSVLRAIAEIRINDLDALDELDAILDRIKEAQGKGNALVHHTWCVDPNTGETLRLEVTARNSFRLKLVPVAADRIKDDALFIYDAGMDLLQLLKGWNLLPNTPPDNRPRFHKTKEARKKRRKKNGAG